MLDFKCWFWIGDTDSFFYIALTPLKSAPVFPFLLYLMPLQDHRTIQHNISSKQLLSALSQHQNSEASWQSHPHSCCIKSPTVVNNWSCCKSWCEACSKKQLVQINSNKHTTVCTLDTCIGQCNREKQGYSEGNFLLFLNNNQTWCHKHGAPATNSGATCLNSTI